jgi:uncharacterized protein
MRTLMILLLASGMAMAEEQAVELTRDDLTLHGTLLHPENATDLVILHVGSGPTDRQGNQQGMINNSHQMLAEGLAENGLAVLRFDKRGVGESRWNQPETEIRPSHYINDLAAWVEWGKGTSDFERIHLVGHSEGGIFSKAAARQVEVASVTAIAAAGRPMGVVLREQTREQLAGAGQLAEQFEHILSELESGRTVDEVPAVFNTLFRPSVQPYLIEWLAMDPAALAAELDAPLLVIGGSTDLQVGRNDFDALAPHAADSHWIEGMNHVLKSAEGTIQEQMPSYVSPDLPLHEALLPVLLDFLGLSR